MSKNQALQRKCQIQEQQIGILKAQNLMKVLKSTGKQDNEQQLEMNKKISSQSTEILKLKEKLSQAKNKIIDLECNIELATQRRQIKPKQPLDLKIQQEKIMINAQQPQGHVKIKNPWIQDDIEFEKERQKLLKKNTSLEASLKSTVEELNNLKIKVAQLTQLQQREQAKRHSINYNVTDEKLFFDLDDNVPKIRKLQEKIKDLESVIQLQMENQKTLTARVKQFKTMEDPESTNILYLKNIILKYMEYLAQKNLKQAETLEYVIFTVLNCEGKDLKRLSNLRESAGLFKFFMPKRMAPPNQARAIKYKNFERNNDALSQSVIYTSREQNQNSLGDLNKSMHGYFNTERGLKNDQNIFNS